MMKITLVDGPREVLFRGEPVGLTAVTGSTVLATNLATHGSFESPEGIPVGGVQSDEWSVEGSFSLRVVSTTGYGTGRYGEGPYGSA